MPRHSINHHSTLICTSHIAFFFYSYYTFEAFLVFEGGNNNPNMLCGFTKHDADFVRIMRTLLRAQTARAGPNLTCAPRYFTWLCAWVRCALWLSCFLFGPGLKFHFLLSPALLLQHLSLEEQRLFSDVAGAVRGKPCLHNEIVRHCLRGPGASS